MHRLRLRHRPLRAALSVAVVVGLTLLAMSAPAPFARAADLTARDVTTALFKASPGQPLDFSGKDLSALDLAGLDFKGANLAGANLYGSDLTKANLSRVRLAGARLDRATLTGADFSEADLSRATILRPNIFSTMDINPAELPTFAEAKMIDAHISGRLDLISFKGADLSGAFFGPRTPGSEDLITPRIEMSGCDFTGAKLNRTDFSLNRLQYAKFMNAEAAGANFADADLSNADFTGADLTDADFTGAVVTGARFEAAKGLKRAKGLDRISPKADR